MISIIVAMAKNNIIGKRGNIPWYISEDLKRTKKITMGHPLIMGRKTHESVGEFYKGKNPELTDAEIAEKRVLPGRTNIVITRDKDYKTSDKAIVVENIEDAINEAKKQPGSEEIFIFGGAEIYKQTIGIADKLYVTHVDLDIDGDVFFPEINNDWKVIEESSLVSKSGITLNFKTYLRSGRS